MLGVAMSNARKSAESDGFIVTARQLGMTEEKVVFRNLSVPIRYDYALLVPKFRPISSLARKMAEQCQAYLVSLLKDLHADTKIFKN
jgi:hypothetical protein